MFVQAAVALILGVVILAATLDAVAARPATGLALVLSADWFIVVDAGAAGVNAGRGQNGFSSRSM